MGYESKCYICNRHTYENGGAWNEVIAAMDMSEMGHDFYELFVTRLDGDFYGMDGAMSRFEQQGELDEPKLVDDYGYELKYASLDRVLGWCDEYMDNTDEFPYWRIAVLQEMLGSFYNLFKPIGNEQLIVVHYGY